MENSPPPDGTLERRPQEGPSSYWRRNLARLSILLSVWFLASYGASILFVDDLDEVSFFGFPLGFWFAQQGSILVFLALTVAYVVTMNRLDDEYAREERDKDSRERGVRK